MKGMFLFPVFFRSIVVTEAKCWHSIGGLALEVAKLASKRNGFFLLAANILYCEVLAIYYHPSVDKITMWIYCQVKVDHL